MKNAVKIIEMTDDTVTVGGYGVVFGGADLEGETFSKSTDFMLDLVPNKLVMYDHAMQDAVKHVIGSAPNGSIKSDDVGLWVEAQLERSAAYVTEIVSLVKAGVIGWSSGTAPHLVQMAGKSITTWPIIEFSLTPTPAEPRTLGVDVLKALSEIQPELKALLPEAAGDVAEGATDGGDFSGLQLQAKATLFLLGEK